MSHSIRHERSTSGRVHHLVIDGDVVATKHYMVGPKFDDQVQGDLIRAYWANGGTIRRIGPVGTSINKALDDLDGMPSRLTPEQVAEVEGSFTGQYLKPLLEKDKLLRAQEAEAAVNAPAKKTKKK